MIELRKETLLGTTWQAEPKYTQILAIATAKSNRLIISRFRSLDQPEVSYIFYSDDNGNTLQQSSINGAYYNTCHGGIHKIIVLPTGRIIGVTDWAVLYSDNNGADWTTVALPDSYLSIRDITFDSATNTLFVSNVSPDDYYASSNDAGQLTGLWKSTDNGETWQRVLRGTISGLAIVNNKLYLSGRPTADSKYSVYCIDLSNDITPENLTELRPTPANSAIDSDVARWGLIAVTPTGRIVIGAIAYTMGIWYTDNNGETWTKSSGQEYTGVLWARTARVLPSGRIMCAGNGDYIDTNLLYSDDNGTTWTRANIPHVAFKAGTIDVANDKLVIVNIMAINSPLRGTVYTSEYIPRKVVNEKYLDQKGAQELVTQFKAFVDNLVGGN